MFLKSNIPNSIHTHFLKMYVEFKRYSKDLYKLCIFQVIISGNFLFPVSNNKLISSKCNLHITMYCNLHCEPSLHSTHDAMWAHHNNVGGSMGRVLVQVLELLILTEARLA